MKAVDNIRNAMQLAERLAMQMFEDVRDQPLMQPTPRGGNHALWVIGHLALSEAEMYSMIRQAPNPLADWGHLFSPGTEPTADGSVYPPFSEIHARYREVRARTMALLDELDDAHLDQPPLLTNPEIGAYFRTIADVLMTIIMHQQFHMGQIADVRRAAGRKPIFA